MNKETNKNSHLSFSQQIYQLLLQVPKGYVTTYSDLAAALNSRAFRAVGSAMAKNKLLICIPCHRVVKNNGEIGHYQLGSAIKQRLLQHEGIEIKDGKVQNLENYLFTLTH